MRQDFMLEKARATMETTVEGCDEAVLIVAEFQDIDYVLAYRGGRYQPWVAGWGYIPERKAWSQGHYFGTIEDAMRYILDMQMAKKLNVA